MALAEPVDASERTSLNAVPQAHPVARPNSAGLSAEATQPIIQSDSLSKDRQAEQSVARALWIVAICAAIAALRLGRELLSPLVLAVLLALVLSGPVEILRRYRIPRGLSALLLLLLIGLGAAGALHAVLTPAQHWMQNAPRVLRTLENKVRPVQSIVRRIDGIAKRASALAGAGDPTGGGGSVAASPATSLSAAGLLEGTSGAAAGLVMSMALALLLLAAGPATLARMAAALATDWRATDVLHIIDAIRMEIGQYYGMLAVLNLLFGSVTALVMWLLGMPNPILWGAVAGILNFIPYLGCATTLAILTIVALVSFDGISQTLVVSASFLVLAGIEGYVVEPTFVGRRLDLNPIVVLVALTANAWMWGIIGNVLTLPLLVAIKAAASQRPNGSAVVRFLSPLPGRRRQDWQGGLAVHCNPRE